MSDNNIVKFLVILTSDYYDEVVDEVIKLASSSFSKAKVYLKYFENTDPSMDVHLNKDDYDDMKKRAQEICDRQIKRMGDAGLDMELLSPHFGIASQEILRIEKQLRLDRIIIVSPKRSIYKKILKGKHFSEEIIHKATTPTLIVRPSSKSNILVTCSL